MDKNRLYYEIKRNNYTAESFSKALGISLSAFRRKATGKSEFTQREIQKALELLHLDSPMGVFFAEEVS